MDYKMPVMNGIQTVTKLMKLQEKGRIKKSRIVFCITEEKY